MPRAVYREVTPEPQSKTNESLFALPSSTKTLLQAWLNRGVYQVPQKVMRICPGWGYCSSRVVGMGSCLTPEAEASALPTTPEAANPVRPSPESFNKSRREIPLVFFMICAPFKMI